MSEQRGVFKNWTLLLAIFAFSLSLLGTFLVRSGVLTSVHAFASDPARGIFILIFLAVVVGGSLTLFAFRKQIIARAKGIGVRLLSMSGLTSAFGNNLDTVNSDMKKRNKASKGKRGIFGLGLRGIGSRFGKLFLRLGAFGALIGGASLLMSGELKLGEKVGGVFEKVKTGFNSLFSVVGDNSRL